MHTACLPAYTRTLPACQNQGQTTEAPPAAGLGGAVSGFSVAKCGAVDNVIKSVSLSAFYACHWNTTMQTLLRKLLSFRFGAVWRQGGWGGFINLEFSDRMWAFLGAAHGGKKNKS